MSVCNVFLSFVHRCKRCLKSLFLRRFRVGPIFIFFSRYFRFKQKMPLWRQKGYSSSQLNRFFFFIYLFFIFDYFFFSFSLVSFLVSLIRLAFCAVFVSVLHNWVLHKARDTAIILRICSRASVRERGGGEREIERERGRKRSLRMLLIVCSTVHVSAQHHSLCVLSTMLSHFTTWCEYGVTRIDWWFYSVF